MCLCCAQAGAPFAGPLKRLEDSLRGQVLTVVDMLFSGEVNASQRGLLENTIITKVRAWPAWASTACTSSSRRSHVLVQE